MTSDAMVKSFLRLMFDPSESTCFSFDARRTKVYSQYTYPQDSRFLSINPLHPSIDLNPTESYHSEQKPRRADANCIKLRTILCEFDKMTIDEQLAFIEGVELPVSSLTFSGNKSIHALIVLDQDVDRLTYDSVVRRVYQILGAAVDPANKNPSRLTRLPNAMRENGKIQKSLFIGERVSLSDLNRWVQKRGGTDYLIESQSQMPLPGFTTQDHHSPKLSSLSKDFLSGNYQEGTWNIQLFKVCCELFRKGNSFENVVNVCTQITGHLDSKDMNTLRSASRTVNATLRLNPRSHEC